MGTNRTNIHSPISPKNVSRLDRNIQIINLRIKGHTLREIADIMGISQHATVGEILHRQLAAVIKPPREELLAVELLKCRQLFNTAMEAATSFHPLIQGGVAVYAHVYDAEGNRVFDGEGKPKIAVVEDKQPKLAGIAAALRVMERYAKLTGLDAAVKLDQTVIGVGVETQSDASRLQHLDLAQLETLKNLLYPGGKAPAPVQQSNASMTDLDDEGEGDSLDGEGDQSQQSDASNVNVVTDLEVNPPFVPEPEVLEPRVRAPLVQSANPPWMR